MIIDSFVEAEAARQLLRTSRQSQDAELLEYMKSFGAWLERLEFFHLELALAIQASLLVKNTGSVPAEDVLVEVRWNTPLEPCSPLAYSDPPQPPQEPIVIRPGLYDFVRQLSEAISFVQKEPDVWMYTDLAYPSKLNPPRVSRPEIDWDEQAAVFRIEKLMHNRAVHLPTLRLSFPSFDGACSFVFTIGVHAANLPTPLHVEFPVHVEPGHEKDWLTQKVAGEVAKLG